MYQIVPITPNNKIGKRKLNNLLRNVGIYGATLAYPLRIPYDNKLIGKSIYKKTSQYREGFGSLLKFT